MFYSKVFLSFSTILFRLRFYLLTERFARFSFGIGLTECGPGASHLLDGHCWFQHSQIWMATVDLPCRTFSRVYPSFAGDRRPRGDEALCETRGLQPY